MESIKKSASTEPEHTASRRLRALQVSVPTGIVFAAAFAPVAQAGVSAQHNETLVRV